MHVSPPNHPQTPRTPYPVHPSVPWSPLAAALTRLMNLVPPFCPIAAFSPSANCSFDDTVHVGARVGAAGVDYLHGLHGARRVIVVEHQICPIRWSWCNKEAKGSSGGSVSP